MQFDPQKHRRRSIRVKGYDYTQPGAYFITLCTYQRECLLGEIVDGKMVLSACGKIVHEEWFKTAKIRENVELNADEFVVMPNHIHGIIRIIDHVGARCHRAPTNDHANNQEVIMPNHVHGIIRIIESPVGATRRVARTGPVAPTHGNRPRGPKPGSIGAIMGQYKAVTTKSINRCLDSPGGPVWQRNYYEHIIRNHREYQAIQGYILANPTNWQLDQDNPANR